MGIYTFTFPLLAGRPCCLLAALAIGVLGGNSVASRSLYVAGSRRTVVIVTPAWT